MRIYRIELLRSLSFVGLLMLTMSCKTNGKSENKNLREENKDTISITILQTADIHGQLDTHPELFWEDGEIVFKNRGGLANIKTLFEKERQQNSNTIIVDGGDLIQGSGYAALSRGKIFPDIIKNMGYDVIIPGNWEVVYGKEVMLDVMNSYDTKVVAHNMFHEYSEKPLFPPSMKRKSITCQFIS